MNAYDFGLEEKIRTCEKCFSLPKRVLLGKGHNQRPRIAIIGTGPSIAGTEENVYPFQLKSKPIFEEILKIFETKIEECWVTNLSKCSKVNEAVGDIGNCKIFFDQEMIQVRPELMLFLGKEAADLYKEKFPSIKFFGEAKLKGEFGYVYWQPSCQIFFYHPMSCIYNPDFKEGYLAKLKLYKDKWIKGPEFDKGQRRLDAWVK